MFISFWSALFELLYSMHESFDCSDIGILLKKEKNKFLSLQFCFIFVLFFYSLFVFVLFLIQTLLTQAKQKQMSFCFFFCFFFFPFTIWNNLFFFRSLSLSLFLCMFLNLFLLLVITFVLAITRGILSLLPLIFVKTNNSKKVYFLLVLRRSKGLLKNF